MGLVPSHYCALASTLAVLWRLRLATLMRRVRHAEQAIATLEGLAAFSAGRWFANAAARSCGRGAMSRKLLVMVGGRAYRSLNAMRVFAAFEGWIR